MYAVCMQYVRSMYAVCMQYVCSMYAVCTQYVCSMYDVCSLNLLSLSSTGFKEETLGQPCMRFFPSPRPALHVFSPFSGVPLNACNRFPGL